MAELKIEIPDELEKIVKELKLDLSEIAAEAISERAKKLKILKEFSSKVKVPDKIAKKFTDRISEAVARRFRESR